MIKIDFKNFVRDRSWFGWECNSIMHELDGGVRGDWSRARYVHGKFVLGWPCKRQIHPRPHYAEIDAPRADGVRTYRMLYDD